MDKERLLKVAEFLETENPTIDGQPFQFSMSTFINRGFDGESPPCGCIATAAVILLGNEDDKQISYSVGIIQRAKAILDLDSETARRLFMSNHPICECDRISAKDAAEHIRTFVETEVVSWDKYL